MNSEQFREQDEAEYSPFVVAYIDILGQQEHFSKFNNIHDILWNWDKYEQPIQEAHQKTYVQVKELRRDFEDFFKEIQKSDVAQKVKDDKKELVEKMRRVNVNHFEFSDTIIAYTSFGIDQQTYLSNVVNGIFTIVGACGILMFSSLAKGKPFRAGISFGLGVEIDKDKKEIYGPALYQAYDIENKIAQYPRIVVSKDLVDCLQTIKMGRATDFRSKGDEGASRGLSEACLNMLAFDYDGKIIVDYLSVGFLKNRVDGLVVKENYLKAFKFVESEYERFAGLYKELGKPEHGKLANRYFLLLNYFYRNKH